MSLDDLNKQLYNENSQEIANRSHEKSLYDPTASNELVRSPFEENENWHQVQKGLSPTGKKVLWGSIIFSFLVAAAIGGYYYYQAWLKDAFHQDRVSIVFDGPKEVDSTQPTKYIIRYRNDNRVTLKNAEIQLSYSENFQPTDNLNLKYLSPTNSKITIGDIGPKSEGTMELKGVFYAPKDFPVYLHGTLNFVPSNATTQLSIENQLGVNIATAPVFLDITAPQTAVDGDSLLYIIDYKNLDIKMMNGMQIKVDLPEGYQMTKGEPVATQGTSWYIGNLDPNQGGKIMISGQINGEPGEKKELTVSIGHLGDDKNFVTYSKKVFEVLVASPVLIIKQTLQDKDSDVIYPGDALKYEIAFKNTGAVGLRDAIVTAQIDGKILDLSKLSVENGSYDSKTGLMTWKASEVPALANIAPQQQGVVHFSIPVLGIIPVTSGQDKNFIVSSIAKIDSPDIPTPVDSNKIIGSNKLTLKLASKVIFENKGYYNDKNIPNSGPIPPKVGAQTTFSLHWLISNISNDITNVKVVGSLPSGVRWLGKVYPTDEKISYNQRTNEIIWNVGDVPAGAGAVSAIKEVEFQVGITPQVNQVGQPIPLQGKSVLTATDTFVNKDITLETPAKDTQLYEDKDVGYAKGKAVQ